MVLNSSATKVLKETQTELKEKKPLRQQDSENRALTKKNSNNMCMLSRQNILQKWKLLCLDKNKAGVLPVMSRQQKPDQVLKNSDKLKQPYISELDILHI